MKEKNRRLQEITQEQNQKLQELNADLEERVSNRTGALANAHEKLEKTFGDLIEMLSELLEIHAMGQRGHGKRVAKLSTELATACKLPPDKITCIETAALCHDIGKIAIPQELLKRTARSLKKNEQDIIDRHPMSGYEILRKISGFETIAEIVRHHHEAFSGRGYPDGLAGHDIPLGSRIIAIADRFDRKVFPLGKSIIASPKEAEASLLRACGYSLDPELVKTLVDDVLPQCSILDFQEVEVTIDKLQPGMVLSQDVTNINGVPYIKSGTKLDQEIISKLLKKEEFDPILSRLFVKGGSIPNAREFVLDNALSQDAKDIPVTCEKVDKKPKVVIVDDQPEVVSALRRELREAGYETVGFTNVQDAMATVRKEKNLFALITDFQMPGVSGDKLLEEVQKERPNLPCIVITGVATQETIFKLSKCAKVTRILPKPWKKDELLDTLDKFKALEKNEAEEPIKTEPATVK
jgi:putative nucleotidyltransferase with HDIG domain